MSVMAHHAEPHDGSPSRELVMKQEQQQGESMDHSHYWDFRGKSRVHGIGLASWNNSSGLWGREPVFSILVPSPGLIQGRGNTGLVDKSQIKELVRGVDLGLVDLGVKDIVISKLFIISGSQLNWKRQSLLSQQGLQKVKNIVKYGR